jgi:uncharacterized protein HemX
MKFLLTTIIALLIGVGIWYFISNQQAGMQQEINTMQEGAQDQADAYRQQQAEMMKQLEQ